MDDSLRFLDTLRTGHPDIDRQHEEIFARAAALVALDPLGDDLAHQAAVLHLLRYVHLHFAAEERLMGDLAYPAAEGHAGRHAWFRREIRALDQRIRADGLLPTHREAIQVLLGGWLKDHILTADVALAAWLRQRSADPSPLADLDALLEEGTELPAWMIEALNRP